MTLLPRRRLIFFLCFLAFVLCLSIGLFNYFIIKKGKVIDGSYGQDSANRSCLFDVAVWAENICRETLDNLARFPKYPGFPDRRYCAKNLSSVVKNGARDAVIKRILVSFSSLEPGFYQFRVKSSRPLRIFLENRNQPSVRDLVLVSSGSTNFPTFFSKSCFLNKNSFLEIITYCPPGDNFLYLDWLVPGSTRFVPILSRDLVPVHHVTLTQKSPRHVLLPDQRTLVGFITQGHIRKGFRFCSLHDVQVWWNGSSYTRNISVYTASSPLDTFVHEVLKLIMASLQKAAPSKYPELKINKLELTQNSTGNKSSRRIFADLNFTVDGLDYVERFSEYLYAYHHGNQLELCSPLCYHWNRAITLSFLFLTDCSRNDSLWGLYFIENIIELLQMSLEVNFRVIITACDERQRRSYESRLRDSDIDRKAVVLQEGVLKRSHAMKAVLSLDDIDNGIMVLCESRVKMPAGIAGEIRKHTFKTLMAYAPVPFRLDCGYFPEAVQVKGDWCPMCGGVTAMYKEDWEQVILSASSVIENEDALKDRETFLGRIEKTGIEIVQVKLQDFYRI